VRRFGRDLAFYLGLVSETDDHRRARLSSSASWSRRLVSIVVIAGLTGVLFAIWQESVRTGIVVAAVGAAGLLALRVFEDRLTARERAAEEARRGPGPA
jgi:hypothetical protein